MARDTTIHSEVGKLKFETDKGAGWAKFFAGLFALSLVGWMGSGYILPAAPEEETVQDTGPRAITVAVITSQAEDIALVLTAEGQSTPDRITPLRSESSGPVQSISAKRGALVTVGDEIARIDSETLDAQLLQAQTALDQAQRDFDNATELQNRGIATQDRVSSARAAQAAAEAQLVNIKEMLDNTIIRAPFTGRLNDLTLDVGEFVSMGSEIGQLLDSDPLTIVVQVPQQALSRLNVGQPADVSFITGEERTGTVNYIGANANAQTRTFQVEIAVENPDSEMPAGLSAQVHIPTGETRGHFISPAILSLDSSGNLGVKTVNSDNTVAFTPATIVRAQTDGVWITGLPETAELITVGQGYVNAGDVVDPRPDEREKDVAEVTQ